MNHRGACLEGILSKVDLHAYTFTLQGTHDERSKVETEMGNKAASISLRTSIQQNEFQSWFKSLVDSLIASRSSLFLIICFHGHEDYIFTGLS